MWINIAAQHPIQSPNIYLVRCQELNLSNLPCVPINFLFHIQRALKTEAYKDGLEHFPLYRD